MSADLTLPGSIPGLLRRGSPVVVVSLDNETTDCDGHRLSVGEYGVLTDAPTSYAVVTGGTVSGEGPPWSEAPVACFALDLTDATGRAHAAWWLAAKAGVPSHAKSNPALPMAAAGVIFHGDPSIPHLWTLATWNRNYGHAFSPHDWLAGENTTVRALETLDPADPRLLPDGSRLVDALALQRVVLHVAGVK